MKNVLIVGGTSDMGFAIARAYAAKGWRVSLAGRNEAELERNARDLAARRDAEVPTFKLDVRELNLSFVDQVQPIPDTVISVVGLLGNQAQAEHDINYAAEVIRTNFEGPALLLGAFAERMKMRGSGTLVGIGSVAGDRGRRSNYVYGASKAGFAAFLSGLRNRLSDSGVHVVTVKPGFVRTRMTAGMKLPNAITANPEEVGRAVYRAAEVTKADVIYVRSVWILIMGIIRNIPERIFKRMKL
jgi:short-subunit dehydrogenase